MFSLKPSWGIFRVGPQLPLFSYGRDGQRELGANLWENCLKKLPLKSGFQRLRLMEEKFPTDSILCVWRIDSSIITSLFEMNFPLITSLKKNQIVISGMRIFLKSPKLHV